jgi:hypothetical protein
MVETADVAGRALRLDATPAERLERFIRECVAVRCGAFAGVAGLIPVSDEMIAAARRSQRLATRLLTDAQAHGDVRPDLTVVDVLRLIELFARAPRTPGEPADPRLLAIALSGLRPDRPLPGPAPGLRQYRERWSPA